MIIKKTFRNTVLGLFLVSALFICRGAMVESHFADHKNEASNASFLVGIAFIGISFIKLGKEQGVFDGLIFAFQDLYASRHFKADQDNARSYIEFKQKQVKNKDGVLSLLLSGTLYLALSLIVLYA